MKAPLICLIFITTLAVCTHHAKKHSVKNRYSKSKHDFPNCIIVGTVYCHGKIATGHMVECDTNEWPGYPLSNDWTKDTGKYSLTTNGLVVLKEPVYIKINHRCPAPGIPVEHLCAFPYYQSNVVVDQRNKTEIRLDIYLDAPERVYDTTCLCL